jgi:hypothetical protein
VLAAATPADVLGELLEEPTRTEVLGLVTGIDHVGFMAPSSAAALLPKVAADAGFDAGHRSFPSTVLARELGALIGVSEVPTTVFRAWGMSDSDRHMTVEAFVVQGVKPEVEAAWIRTGVAGHTAFAVESLAALHQVAIVMSEQGWSPPAGVGAQPAWNAAEELALVYFDRRLDGRTVRLEYCATRAAA